MSPTLALLMLATIMATLPWQQVAGQDGTTTMAAPMDMDGGETMPPGADEEAMTTMMKDTHMKEKSESGAPESTDLSGLTIVSSTLLTLIASHL